MQFKEFTVHPVHANLKCLAVTLSVFLRSIHFSKGIKYLFDHKIYTVSIKTKFIKAVETIKLFFLLKIKLFFALIQHHIYFNHSKKDSLNITVKELFR